MTVKKVLLIGSVGGLIGGAVSALLPSPVTLATFKPWASEDPVVRKTFWISIGLVSGLVLLTLMLFNSS
jgi:hypothetical protein